MDRPVFKVLLIAAAIAIVIVWLVKTPPGLLGKADAFGYAVCHQAPLRSFAIGDRPTPLCARCSGTFLGTLIGIIYLGTQGRKAGLPPFRFSLILVAFLMFFAIDGLNSFVRLLPGLPHLYTSQNWLRLISGTGLGIGIASVLLPVFHQTMWITYIEAPLLSTWKQMGALIGLSTLLVTAFISQNPLILYPLAVISGFTVLILLTIVYSILWVLVSQHENRYDKLIQLWTPLLAGFVTAMVQISLISAGRFWLTGTWAGFPLAN
jgi:uncharacterized membrane protein